MQTSDWAYFPLFFRLRGEAVLVVGGGEVAVRKVRLLRRAGAQIRLVSLDLHEELQALAELGDIVLLGAEFAASQLAGCRLVVAATDDRAVNRAVVAAADAAGVPANAVDDPEVSRWITPSIIDRQPISIAISTGGDAPVLGRRLRERLEQELPARLGDVARYMGSRRARVQQALPIEQRRGLWEAFVDGAGASAVLNQDLEAADRELQRLIDAGPAQGEVCLVGAGPGDPDLLTLRALRLMQSCDVVLFDALIPPAIIDLVRRDAERIYVGKRRAKHSLPQDEINAELVRHARLGRKVLRLKGGDPFVFGRGGEEIAELKRHGIAFQVVPGVSAANGCAAYAGIPLTHRDYAQSVVFVTGHARADGSLQLNWPALAQRGQTVVIYMGLGALRRLCAELIHHGLPADWPAAVIESGTSPQQQVFCATLGTLPALMSEQTLNGPTLVIVGEVVRLRDQLKWHG